MLDLKEDVKDRLELGHDRWPDEDEIWPACEYCEAICRDPDEDEGIYIACYSGGGRF